MFGPKKNCYTMLLEAGGDMVPIESVKDGDTVAYKVNGKEHTYKAPLSQNPLRFKGKKCYVVPEGKGESVDIRLEKFESAITDLTMDDAIQDNSMRQFLEFMRSAGKVLAQNWAIIIMLLAVIMLVFWDINTTDKAAKVTTAIWNQVRPTITPTGPATR